MTKLLCLLLLSGVVSAQSNPAQSSVTVIATDTSLTWKWAPVVGATSYSIWMVDGSSGTYAQTWIRVARITTASYALTGLAPGTAMAGPQLRLSSVRSQVELGSTT